MPEWALYKVLAFKVNEQKMRELAELAYDFLEIDEGDRAIFNEDLPHNNWFNRPLLLYFRKKWGFTVQVYNQGWLRWNLKGLLLAVCTSVPLGTHFLDIDFSADHVRPETKGDELGALGSFLGINPPEPMWYIPDQGLNFQSLKIQSK